MNNDQYIHIWEQKEHVPENQKIDKTMITKYLQPRISRVRWGYNFNLLTYLAAILGSIVMLSMNIYGYRTNPVMLGIETGLLAISFGFLGYGLFILMKIREINTFTKDLRELLQAKLRFLRFHYEIWILFTAFVVLILIFALNTLVDNQDGIYRINRTSYYVLVNLFIFIFIYGVQKLSASFYFRELKGYLYDLETGYLEGPEVRARKRKKMRWIFLGLGLFLLIAGLLGFLRALGII